MQGVRWNVRAGRQLGGAGQRRAVAIISGRTVAVDPAAIAGWNAVGAAASVVFAVASHTAAAAVSSTTRERAAVALAALTDRRGVYAHMRMQAVGRDARAVGQLGRASKRRTVAILGVRTVDVEVTAGG